MNSYINSIYINLEKVSNIRTKKTKQKIAVAFEKSLKHCKYNVQCKLCIIGQI